MRATRKIAFGVVSLVAVVWLGAGCVGDPRLEEQRSALAREHRERMERLERVEARLLAAEARRAEWTELKVRHGRVTELACESASAHVEAMARHEERERDKRRLRARRVAAVSPGKALPGTSPELGDAPVGLGEGGPAD